jgi:hypothetical protein
LDDAFLSLLTNPRTVPALAAALTQENPDQPAIKTTLERGLVVSLRDGVQERAVRFATRLHELGAKEIPDLTRLRVLSSNRNTVAVPGSMKALALAALMHEEVGLDRFASLASSYSVQVMGTLNASGKGFSQIP